MSVDISVAGFKPADETWKRMKAVWDACQAAKIEVPKDVGKFFNFESPDDAGVTVNRKQLGDAVREYSAEMCDGFEIVLSKLPKDVTIIRVWNSY